MARNRNPTILKNEDDDEDDGWVPPIPRFVLDDADNIVGPSFEMIVAAMVVATFRLSFIRHIVHMKKCVYFDCFSILHRLAC